MLRTSATTPTICDGSCAMPVTNVRPIGFSPGKCRRANVSLTMTTCGTRELSRSSKSRPARIGIPSVAKYRGETRCRFACGRSLSGGSGRPPIATGAGVCPPVSGTRSVSAADVLPGSVDRR